MSQTIASFSERLQARRATLSPAELKVAQYFLDHRESALMSSAAAIASRIETSDATVVRTAKSLGFSGLDDLRRALADELRGELTLAGRVARTVGELGENPAGLLGATLDLHRASLKQIEQQVTAGQFAQAVATIAAARRLAIFGIGPSSAMAAYFAIQAGRLGIEAMTLTHTGLLLADDLSRLKSGDALVMLAYGRVYPELTAMVAHAGGLSIPMILMTDTLAGTLRPAMDVVLEIPRGRSDLFSMHTSTIAVMEALLVALAAERPAEAILSLEALNRLRGALARPGLDL